MVQKNPNQALHLINQLTSLIVHCLCLCLPLVQTLDIVREGGLGGEGANLPVLDPTEHRAEAGVRGSRLGAGARLVLKKRKLINLTILFICFFELFFSYNYSKTFS